MISALAFIVCVCFAQSAQAHILGVGTCPNVTAIRNFVYPLYLGDWYEYSRYYDLPVSGTKCTKTTFSESENSDGFNFETVGYRLGSKTTIKGTAIPDIGEDGRAKYIVKFDDSPALNYTTYILASGFESYIVIWSCADIGTQANDQRAWVITRSRSPSNAILGAAYAAFPRENLSSSLMIVDQTDCENYESS